MQYTYIYHYASIKLINRFISWSWYIKNCVHVETANASRIITINIITTFTTIQYVFIYKLLFLYTNNDPQRDPRYRRGLLFWAVNPVHSQKYLICFCNLLKATCQLWFTRNLLYENYLGGKNAVLYLEMVRWCWWSGVIPRQFWSLVIPYNIGLQYYVTVLNQIESLICGVMTHGLE